MNVSSPAAWLLVLFAALLLWLSLGGPAGVRRRRERRWRRRFEDAVKHVLTWQQRSQNATPESLAGALGWSAKKVLRLVTRMEAGGLLRSVSGGLRLTPEGERLGLHVMRAHRLVERYLADEAGLPLGRLHPAAEKAEHNFTREGLDELEAHLGHPRRDPHGDPIPTREGALERLDAVPLTDWPPGEPARIVHIEDEPTVVFEQILAADLQPGMTIRVIEDAPQRMLIRAGEGTHSLTHAAAANIQVAAARNGETLLRRQGAIPLSQLPDGAEGQVVELDPRCRGFTRRRLMDLGITPGARICVSLPNTFGDPRAFRVRGTTIALRNDQAELIWVRPINGAGRNATAAA